MLKAKPENKDLAAGPKAHRACESYTSQRGSAICDVIDMGATDRRDLAKPCQGYLAATPLQRVLPGSLGRTQSGHQRAAGEPSGNSHPSLAQNACLPPSHAAAAAASPLPCASTSAGHNFCHMACVGNSIRCCLPPGNAAAAAASPSPCASRTAGECTVMQHT